MWTDTGRLWQLSQPLKINETETDQYQAVSFFSSNLLQKQKYYCVPCVCECVRVCVRQWVGCNFRTARNGTGSSSQPF